MTSLNHAQALAEFESIRAKTETTFSPKKLPDELREKLEFLEHQLDPTNLAENIASMLRVLWVATTHAGGEIEDSDAASTIWLAAELCEVCAQMSGARGDVELRLGLHKEAVQKK